MKVIIPTHLRAYTNEREVEAHGATLDDALRDLDRQFPGFRYRIIDEQDVIREHIKLFVNDKQVWQLATALQATDTIRIIAALSGG